MLFSKYGLIPEPGHYKSDSWEFKIPEGHPDIVSIHMKPYQKPHPPIALAGSSPKSDTLIFAGRTRLDSDEYQSGTCFCD